MLRKVALLIIAVAFIAGTTTRLLSVSFSSTLDLPPISLSGISAGETIANFTFLRQDEDPLANYTFLRVGCSTPTVIVPMVVTSASENLADGKFALQNERQAVFLNNRVYPGISRIERYSRYLWNRLITLQPSTASLDSTRYFKFYFSSECPLGDADIVNLMNGLRRGL